MNDLSWLIYAADVAGSVSGVLSVTAFGSVVAGIGSGIGYLVMGESPHVWSWDDAEAKVASHNATRTVLKKILKRAPIVFFAAALTASVIPGKDTIYAIAASEVGENVLNSQTGDKAVKALNAWLDKKIAEAK